MPEVDFDRLWNFDDPAATEAKFRALRQQIADAGDHGRLLELDTQIARTQGLQKRFDDAFLTLAAVQAALRPGETRAEIRHRLELGRALRASGKPAEARPHFEAAAAQAEAAGQDALAIDAQHMVALVEPDAQRQIEIGMAALRFAETSTDPKARGWQASLWNNIGMSYHDLARLDDALAAFEKALALRKQMDNPNTTRIAHWMIGWTLRLQGRLAEACAIQEALEPFGSGYTFEELAEIHLARGQDAQARGYFAKAWPLLADDLGDGERLARMKRLAGG